MERRTALVASVVSGTSLAIGVVAFAAIGGAPILGLGGGAGAGATADPVVVHQVVTVDDPVMVSTRPTEVPRAVPRNGSEAPAVVPLGVVDPSTDGITVSIGRSAPVGVVAAPTPGSTTPTDPSAPSSPVTAAPLGSAPATSAPATPNSVTGASDNSPLPSTSAPVTAPVSGTATTVAPPPTTAARPPGVPADWPTGTPIPPMPADCQKPQLEDNGVWNCDH